MLKQFAPAGRYSRPWGMTGLAAGLCLNAYPARGGVSVRAVQFNFARHLIIVHYCRFRKKVRRDE